MLAYPSQVVEFGSVERVGYIMEVPPPCAHHGSAASVSCIYWRCPGHTPVRPLQCCTTSVSAYRLHDALGATMASVRCLYVQALRNTQHNGFPVASCRQGGPDSPNPGQSETRFAGCVLRSSSPGLVLSANPDATAVTDLLLDVLFLWQLPAAPALAVPPIPGHPRGAPCSMSGCPRVQTPNSGTHKTLLLFQHSQLASMKLALLALLNLVQELGLQALISIADPSPC